MMRLQVPEPGEPEDWINWGKIDPNKEYLYRYMDMQIVYADRTVIQIHCFAYEIIKRTDKGYWIKMSDSYWPRGKNDPIPRDCQKFVLDLSNFRHLNSFYPPKRFAYESIDHAATSFKIRKARQQGHIERQLERVKRVNKMIEDGEFKTNFPHRVYSYSAEHW